MRVTRALRSARKAIDQENRYAASNYASLPVVINRCQGVHMYDCDGKEYFDFLSAYSAVNQGHCHPGIMQAAVEQLQTCHLTSRAFHNDQLGPFAEYVTNLFGFDRVLPMNTGAEGVETACKIARKWAYEVKGVEPDQATIVFAKRNFHGRTMAVISASSDPDAFGNFGPKMPGLELVPYNNLVELEKELKKPNCAAYLVEPIQGEAGIIIPDEGYLKGVRALCDKYNVLWIDDEIQTGLARTGKLLAVDYENVKPDLLILGKALSGGVYPVSAVLGNDETMLCIKPGQHGSTYGGNPLACAVATTALEALFEKREDLDGRDMLENSVRQGEMLRKELNNLPKEIIKDVRGKGLLNAIEIHDGFDAQAICTRLMENGLLAKPTQSDKIRFAPPLIIRDTQLHHCTQIIADTVYSFL